MNIHQVKHDFDNHTSICRKAIGEVIELALRADAGAAGAPAADIPTWQERMGKSGRRECESLALELMQAEIDDLRAAHTVASPATTHIGHDQTPREWTWLAEAELDAVLAEYETEADDTTSQAEPVSHAEEDAESGWRRLALQFDGHRMQAIWHLKAMLQDPIAHRSEVEKFLSAGPLSGEEILAQRIKAIAEAVSHGGAVAPSDDIATLRAQLEASEESRIELLRLLNEETSGSTFMGEPVLPPRHDVSEMVNRFLGWKLPQDFAPDCGISFDGRKDDEWNKNKTWPVGTNLLTAIQAKAMLENVLADALAEHTNLSVDAMAKLAPQLADAVRPSAQPAATDLGAAIMALPFAILDDEYAALRRFHECAEDGEGYDVPDDMMKRLAEIGLIHRARASRTYYQETDFGLSVLNGDFALAAAMPSQQADK